MAGNKHINRVTLLLVGLSATLLQVALEDRVAAGSGMPLLGVSFGLALLIRVFAVRSGVTSWRAFLVVAVALLGVLPFAWDAVARSMLWRGDPLEVQLACMLRNLMLGLAALQHLPRARGLTAFASLFLVVNGFLWSANPVTIALLVVYGLAGMWWLVGTYWELLGGRFADETEPSAPIQPTLLAVLLIALLLLAAAPFATRSTTTALAGFFPSSGGTGWNDPFAYGGVGDGDQMVAAKENASSFGPVESDLFLESKMPSLYDAFNEFSEAVPKKKKKQSRRAIPLAPSMTQMNHEKKGLTQKTTREFSTVRQPTERRSNSGDRLSKALLLVSGRTPVHLALETYDRWDGRSLVAAESADASSKPLRRQLRGPDESGRRWFDLSVIPLDKTFTTSTETQVRVINLRTERVPTPPNTTSVSIDKLHSASMFSFASDGSFAMDVDHIPQLTIFRLRSALRDRSANPSLATAEPGGFSPAIVDLATEWTAGTQKGWPQVHAVINRLRTGYEHDQQAMIPDSAEDAVEHFLFDARRGPDYVFAASAAVLLRSLGYETRVRSGLYASPERYDRISRLTTVMPEDVHFWVEVKSTQGVEVAPDGATRQGVWIAIEPTPGYDILYAPESPLAIAQRWCWQAVSVVASRPAETILACSAVWLIVLRRRQILDAVFVASWSVSGRVSGPRELTRFTLRLIEWRAWLYGQTRPIGAPLGRWDALAGQDDFKTAASWALYGEGTAAPLPLPSIREACRCASRVAINRSIPGRPTPGQPVT